MGKLGLVLICIFSCIKFSFAVSVKKNISYASNGKGIYNQLDIYSKNKSNTLNDVIIFIHGGSWRSGDKKDYWWLGRNLARKNITAVIINYPLSPKSKYDEMALDCAIAVKWVFENIHQHGGNKDRIFLMGHSAGGHLSALIAQDQSYFKKLNFLNPVKGVILNDAFGLDMYEYLTVDKNGSQVPGFLQTFSNNPENWKKASPINYLSQKSIPYLISYGEKTYPAIKLQSVNYHSMVSKSKQPTILKKFKNKKHIGMITQMIFGCNRMYDYIHQFLSEVK